MVLYWRTGLPFSGYNTLCVLKDCCSQTDWKLLLSSEREILLEKTVAYDMEVLQRRLESGLLIEDKIENADETHIIFNIGIGKTQGFVGHKHVEYADVVSAGDPLTMMVCLPGERHSQMFPPMIVFESQKHSNPTRGVPDDVPGGCYRSSPPAWIDGCGIIPLRPELSERRRLSRRSTRRGKRRAN